MFSVNRPPTYRSESLIIVNTGRADPALVADLIRQRGLAVSSLSGGLLRLASEASSPESARQKLQTVTQHAQDTLSGILPNSRIQETAAREEYRQLLAIADQATSVEEKIKLVDSLRALQTLRVQGPENAEIFRVVAEPNTPLSAKPRYFAQQFAKGAAIGLMLGATAAYVLYNRRALFQAGTASKTVNLES